MNALLFKRKNPNIMIVNLQNTYNIQVKWVMMMPVFHPNLSEMKAGISGFCQAWDIHFNT